MTFALSIKQILKILPISYQKPFGTTSKSQGIVLDPSLPLGYISIALPKLSPKPFLELLFPMGLSVFTMKPRQIRLWGFNFFDTIQKGENNYKKSEKAGLNQHWFIGTRVANLATDQMSLTTKCGTKIISQ